MPIAGGFNHEGSHRCKPTIRGSLSKLWMLESAMDLSILTAGPDNWAINERATAEHINHSTG